MSVIGQAFVEVLPLATGFAGALQKELSAGLTTAKTQATQDFNGLAAVGQKAALGVGVAVLAIGAMSIRAATNFETLTTSLVTGAGESASSLGMVRQGILNLAPAMGTSTTNLTNGLYMIESAGFHGAAGLSVLKAAAEGAKVGNADLATVANAVTTALTDYHLPASQATAITSMLVETVASGKTHMQDLAGALSEVLPVAAAAHINLADVTGALATMTGQGISAQQASQNLANTIRQLQSPSQQAISIMGQFGVNATNLAQNLGQRGVSGSLDVLVAAIAQHMGPAGLVLEGTFKQSQAAATDAQTEFANLPPSLKAIGTELLNGTISQSAYRTQLKGMSLDNRQLVSELKSTVDQTRGFSSALKSGTPDAVTMSTVLSQMLGGATGLNTALALTGPNMTTYRTNIANITKAGKDGATTVQGFGLVQKDFGFQVDQAKQAVSVMFIEIGEKLIPIVEKAAGAVKDSAQFFMQHKDIALALAGILGGVLVAAIGAYALKMVAAAATTIAEQGKMVGKFIENNAKMIASIVEWAATQAASLVETAALWVMYTLGVESAGLATALATGGIILAVAAVAAAAYLIVTHWKDISAFFVGLWHDVERIFKEAWDAVTGQVQPVVDAVVGAWNTGIGAIETAFNAVKDWFAKWWPVLLAIMLPGLGIIIDEIILHWHTLLEVTKTVFGAISDAISFVWHYVSEAAHIVLDPLITYISASWRAVSAITSVVWDLIKTYFTIWWAAISGMFNVALALVKGTLQQAWNDMMLAVHLVWDAIKAYFQIWWAVVSGLVQIGWDIIRGIFTVALDLIEGKWGAAWGAIKDTFSSIMGTVEDSAKAIWGAISGFFSGALSAFSGWWGSTWNNIAGTFSGVWNGIAGSIAGIWRGITGGISAGIRDVENVINSAFISPINTVLGVFGVHVTPFNTSTGAGGGGSATAFGTGGSQGGMKRAARGMVVDSPTVLVGEGRRGFPEWVIPSDPLYRDRAHKLLASLLGTIGMPKLASGGILGGIVGAVENATGISAIKSALGWADRTIVGPAIDGAAGAAEGLVSHIPPAMIGQAAAGLIKQVANAIKGMLGAGGPAGGLKGMIPSGAHAGLIAQALAVAGVPVDPPDEAAVNLIVTHESNWNPQAANMWDINAQHGDPSRGLMQTIGSTFEAYRAAQLPDDIFDPLSNLVAGIRYAVSRYGSLTNVPGVRAVANGGAYVGYDSGGWLMPGVTMAYNGTGRPEPVISPTGAGPAGAMGGVTIMPGAVSVQVELVGDTTTGAGVQQLVEQGVQQGVSQALDRMLTIMQSRNPAQVRS